MANDKPAEIKRSVGTPPMPGSTPAATSGAVPSTSLQEEQPVSKRPSPGKRDLLTRMAEIEQYLVDNGWEMMGTNERGQSIWSDPTGASRRKPILEPRVRLPVKGGADGDVEMVKQWVQPPTSWTYPVDEAVMIQKQRDAAEQKQPAVV